MWLAWLIWAAGLLIAAQFVIGGVIGLRERRERRRGVANDPGGAPAAPDVRNEGNGGANDPGAIFADLDASQVIALLALWDRPEVRGECPRLADFLGRCHSLKDGTTIYVHKDGGRVEEAGDAFRGCTDEERAAILGAIRSKIG